MTMIAILLQMKVVIVLFPLHQIYVRVSASKNFFLSISLEKSEFRKKKYFLDVLDPPVLQIPEATTGNESNRKIVASTPSKPSKLNAAASVQNILDSGPNFFDAANLSGIAPLDSDNDESSSNNIESLP